MTAIGIPVPPVFVVFVMAVPVVGALPVPAMPGVIVPIRDGRKCDDEKSEESQHGKDHSFHIPSPEFYGSLLNPYLKRNKVIGS